MRLNLYASPGLFAKMLILWKYTVFKGLIAGLTKDTLSIIQVLTWSIDDADTDNGFNCAFYTGLWGSKNRGLYYG
jgi:hypothetical protein